MREITLVTYIAQRIEELNIKHVFGVPGSYIMPIWQAIADKTEIVLACHETGAGFMAEGYARCNKKVSVLLTTSAPGLTNAITAISNAYMDSIPMIIISGQVETYNIGHGAFQECSSFGRSSSQKEFIESVTKAQIEIIDNNNAQFLFENALHIATSGRPGPVHISIPLNIQTQVIAVNHKMFFYKNRKTDNFYKECDLIKYANLINKSKRPLMYIGWGSYLSNSTLNVEKLSAVIHAPIISTIKGIAAISPENDLFIDHIGMGANKKTNEFIEEYNPDLIIALGSSLSSRTLSNLNFVFKNTSILNVNIDIDCFKQFDTIDIHMDINDFLISIMPLMKEDKNRVIIVEQIKSFKDKKNIYISSQIQENEFNMSTAIFSINRYLDTNTVVFPDSGNHWLDCLYLLRLKSSEAMFLSMGLATMGYAFGGVVGFSLGNPSKKVVIIGGDGSFLMSGNEIITAVKKNLNIVIIVINNSSLGRVRVAQNNQKNSHYGTSNIPEINYSTVAQSYGFVSFRVKNTEEMDIAYKYAFEGSLPSFIEIIANKNDIPIFLKEK